MQLHDFFDYKNQLMADLLTNPKIVSLIDGDIAFEDAEELMYTHVFPCEYVPDTAEFGQTYICADVDLQRAANKTYYSLTLYIWVFTHRSLLRLPEGGVRTDELCSEICEQINGSMKYGLGELDLYATKRFAPMTDYQGKVLIFHAEDFNRLYNPKKEIPVNRKNG